MRVFALGDPHLPGGKRDRPMHRFGPAWWHHREKILKRAWQTVAEGDILLLPGDLSWATKRGDALDDLAFLAMLPGVKVCIRGNHDFWWDSDRPLNYPGLHSPPVQIGDFGIAGTRGCDCTEPPSILERERKRLRKSLEGIHDAPMKIAMLHHPPQPFADILSDYSVRVCAFGHVHRDSLPEDEALVLNGEPLGDVICHCVACDRIEFTPKQVFPQSDR